MLRRPGRNEKSKSTVKPPTNPRVTRQNYLTLYISRRKVSHSIMTNGTRQFKNDQPERQDVVASGSASKPLMNDCHFVPYCLYTRPLYEIAEDRHDEICTPGITVSLCSDHSDYMTVTTMRRINNTFVTIRYKSVVSPSLVDRLKEKQATRMCTHCTFCTSGANPDNPFLTTTDTVIPDCVMWLKSS